jgi:non-reducing end alpha-L-arabinofuranosidase
VDAGKPLDAGRETPDAEAGVDSGSTGTPDAGGTHDGGVDSGSSGTSDAGAVTGPCDIYATAGTPCVAAHSTVRALFGAYDGNLYQVKRASDGTTKNIGVLSAGGFANAATQDTFCTGTTCTISTIFDQSAMANHLTPAPPGGNKHTPGNPASATSQKLTISGHEVYAVVVNVGIGYRIDATSGIAKGDSPEGEYMVTSGTHFNGGCCFDYGNAETNNDDDGNGTMEAVYFGNSTDWGSGAGTGPWVMADLENGLYTATNFTPNPMNTALKSAFVTAMVKGHAGGFALKGGNAQSGTLKTMYNGGRPTAAGYNPMKKQGAIILGIGGDNSNSAVGTFFEGVMTSGNPPDAADDAVQANIVAAGYGK